MFFSRLWAKILHFQLMDPNIPWILLHLSLQTKGEKKRMKNDLLLTQTIEH